MISHPAEKKTESLKKWKQVLSDYGEVLTQVSLSGLFIPESKLPHARDKLKKAMLDVLAESGNENSNLKNCIEMAYLNLSLFIPDSDAARLASEATASLYQSRFCEIHARMMRLTGEYLQDLNASGKLIWRQNG